MAYYVCTPDYGDAKPKPEGAHRVERGDPFSPLDSETSWVRRYGDDREPAEAFAAFFQAVVEDEWASIYYCS